MQTPSPMALAAMLPGDRPGPIAGEREARKALRSRSTAVAGGAALVAPSAPEPPLPHESLRQLDAQQSKVFRTALIDDEDSGDEVDGGDGDDARDEVGVMS
jgi:hypothetical protein